MKDLRAVGEERRAAFAQVQPPRIELDEGADERGGRSALTSGKSPHFVDELVVRERVGWIGVHEWSVEGLRDRVGQF